MLRNRIKILVTATALFTLCCAADNPIDQYAAAMKALAKHCSMDYHADFVYPGSKKNYTVDGHMAINNDWFCDSSNLRFAFRNDTWMFLADHQNKEIDYLYLPRFRKEMGDKVDLQTSDYLLSSDQMSQYQSMKVANETAAGYDVQLVYNNEAIPFKDLNLHFSKGKATPNAYEGTLSYPAYETYNQDGTVEARDTSRIYIRFSCFNINPQPDDEIFDDSRLVLVKHGKATLKRYNNYKTARPQ